MSAMRDALQRQMAVRVELDADDAFRPDDGAHALDDVAFDVVVAVRDHGAVQAEQHAVDRQRRLELGQDLVAHGLVVGAVGGAGRAGGEAAALDQREASALARAAADEQRRGAHARRVGRDARRAGRNRFLVDARLVGSGEKVLVSVASVAVKRRIGCSSFVIPSEAGRRRSGGLQCRCSNRIGPSTAPRYARSGRDDGVCARIVGEPDIARGSRRDVAQRAPEMPQAVRLADDVGVQRHAHHQRARRATAPASRRTGRRSCRRIPRAVTLRRDDRGNVVQLLRIGHGEDAAAARAQNQTGWSSMHQSSR